MNGQHLQSKAGWHVPLCWHSDCLTKSPSRAETQASDASQMAVRSWPPSSAITTRPPARPMSSCVSCPKPASTQQETHHSTQQSCQRNVLVIMEASMRRSHLAETMYPPSGDWWPSTASKPADTRTTSGLKCWAMGITTYLFKHPVKWNGALS